MYFSYTLPGIFMNDPGRLVITKKKRFWFFFWRNQPPRFRWSSLSEKFLPWKTHAFIPFLWMPENVPESGNRLSNTI